MSMHGALPQFFPAMVALFFFLLLDFNSVTGQSSPLNKYQCSKGVQLMYRSHEVHTVRTQAATNRVDCASLCSALSDCRAFNFNWQAQSCQLLAWTEHSANTDTQQNAYNNLCQKKDYIRNCFVGKGENYRGTKSVTKSGITCQHWKSKFPQDHRHSMTPTNGLEENYCRNPDGDEIGPWCYTIKENIRHEDCGIKKCDVDVCVTCNGEDYRGFVDYTKSGRECQRWDLQSPHKHHYQPEKYPDKGLNDNYCRNPDGSVHPWCYTTDPNVEREHCNIQKCTEKHRLRNVEFTTKCFKKHGVGYRGTVNTTTSGIPCQRWDSQTPHNHNFLPENYECKGLEENYCRNPDGSEAPWCFTTLPAMRVAFCLQIKRCPEDIEAEDCYHGNGKSYNGKVAKTRKGITCQKWTDETPHKSEFNPKAYPEADLQENYCRNPDGDSHGPWCYTMDPNTKFDYCAIKPCGDLKPSIIENPEKIEFDECGKRSDRMDNRARIVGGIPGNSPWTISLRNRDGIHFCGGSLVDVNWIISTRQCFTSCDLDPQGYEAWMGTLFIKPQANDPQKQAIPISKIFCGPAESYLVMLKLARPAELNSRVALICLPPEKYIVPEGTSCEIAGWGDTRGTGYENQLKVAKLTVLSNKDCKRVKENEMCTQPLHAPTGACEGDYGGPLACFTHDCWVLEGVIIPSRGCGKANQPGMYIRVSMYVDWIQKVMKMN
ncbi:hepatocyte growth factor-like protein isoform X3 [Protopterus annectens]|uniref:hepatocyte growth factor-like protein isoform X3 n=1 Tax=Protopterus annectens TaxID=7888 RepID=UPI001CFB437D|nr:hepatocyte growth factor-like protein isoform X3 [Protopterus annectens]